MKKLVLLIAIIFSSVSMYSQSNDSLFPLNPETGEVYFSEVINVEGKSQDNLFLSARTWFANAFNSSNDVVQLIDNEKGVIIGKGIIIYKKGIVNFSVKISTREERYKYEIYDLKYKATAGGHIFDLKDENPIGIMRSMWISQWKKDRNSTLEKMKILIASLTEEMKSDKQDSKKNDW